MFFSSSFFVVFQTQRGIDRTNSSPGTQTFEPDLRMTMLGRYFLFVASIGMPNASTHEIIRSDARNSQHSAAAGPKTHTIVLEMVFIKTLALLSYV